MPTDAEEAAKDWDAAMIAIWSLALTGKIDAELILTKTPKTVIVIE